MDTPTYLGWTSSLLALIYTVRIDATDCTTTPTHTFTAATSVRAFVVRPCGKWCAVRVLRCSFLTITTGLQGPGLLAATLGLVCVPGWLLEKFGTMLDGLVFTFQISIQK